MPSCLPSPLGRQSRRHPRRPDLSGRKLPINVCVSGSTRKVKAIETSHRGNTCMRNNDRSRKKRYDVQSGTASTTYTLLPRSGFTETEIGATMMQKRHRSRCRLTSSEDNLSHGSHWGRSSLTRYSPGGLKHVSPSQQQTATGEQPTAPAVTEKLVFWRRRGSSYFIRPRWHYHITIPVLFGNITSPNLCGHWQSLKKTFCSLSLEQSTSRLHKYMQVFHLNMWSAFRFDLLPLLRLLYWITRAQYCLLQQWRRSQKTESKADTTCQKIVYKYLKNAMCEA